MSSTRSRWLAVAMAGFVLLATACGATDEQPQPTPARIPTPITSAAAPDDANGSPGKLKLGDTAIGGPDGDAQDSQKQLQMFLEAWNMVEQEYYDQSAIDRQKMARGAIKGMLEALGDEGTSFSDPPSTQIARQDMSGSFEGIGVTVEMRSQRITIITPFDGSPGAKAGLRAGDVVTKIDDKDATKLSLADAVGLIRGQRGSTVRLTVAREGEAQPIAVAVVRDTINVPSVSAKILEGNVGYVKINQFVQPTPDLLGQQLGDLMAKKPKALVLDLRNNPGGALASAVQVASQFIGDGVLLYAEQRDTPRLEVDALPGGLATEVPLIVLINRGTSSAAEIVAGALQDRGRGVLIGEPSYGKDTMQTVHQLPDGSTVSITTARWYTPKKQEIYDKGLTPNLPVALSPEDAKAGRDPQLDRAMERAATGR